MEIEPVLHHKAPSSAQNRHDDAEVSFVGIKIAVIGIVMLQSMKVLWNERRRQLTSMDDSH